MKNDEAKEFMCPFFRRKCFGENCMFWGVDDNDDDNTGCDIQFYYRNNQ